MRVVGEAEAEVYRIIDVMKAAAIAGRDPAALCQSILVETRVRELSFPDDGHIEPRMISPYAQAVVVRELRKSAEGEPHALDYLRRLSA